jgi:hypothetical protein
VRDQLDDRLLDAVGLPVELGIFAELSVEIGKDRNSPSPFL